MRVEMIMENRVTGRTIAITGATEVNPVAVAGTGPDPLCIEVVRVVVIGIEQPLVVVQVEYMVFAGTDV